MTNWSGSMRILCMLFMTFMNRWMVSSSIRICGSSSTNCNKLVFITSSGLAKIMSIPNFRIRNIFMTQSYLYWIDWFWLTIGPKYDSNSIKYIGPSSSPSLLDVGPRSNDTEMTAVSGDRLWQLVTTVVIFTVTTKKRFFPPGMRRIIGILVWNSNSLDFMNTWAYPREPSMSDITPFRYRDGTINSLVMEILWTSSKLSRQLINFRCCLVKLNNSSGGRVMMGNIKGDSAVKPRTVRAIIQ